MKPLRPPSHLSSLVIALSIFPCPAIRDRNEHFSSTITYDRDYPLKSKSSSHNIQSHQLHYNNGRELSSAIDRDPIIYEDNILGSHESCDGNYFSIRDALSTSIRKRHQLWQSPLERIGSLTSIADEYSFRGLVDRHFNTISTHQNEANLDPSQILKHQIERSAQNWELNTRSTGTTITALLACNSTVVILAADTRATDRSTVADKRCEKLHMLASNVWCAGAGTSADVDALVRIVKFVFWRKGILTRDCIGNMGNKVDRWKATVMGDTLEENIFEAADNYNLPSAPVASVVHFICSQLQSSRGALGVNLLVGGYDPQSNHATLAAIHPHGSVDVVTYAALGSGGMAAIGVLESCYPRIGSRNCSLEEGIRLVVDAVRAGIDNDLGSGSQVDICVISGEGVLYKRAIVKEEMLEWINMNEDPLKRDDPVEDEHENCVEHSKITTSGVNGFGNIPFSIQSKKVVVTGECVARREKKKWLDSVLGT